MWSSSKIPSDRYDTTRRSILCLLVLLILIGLSLRMIICAFTESSLDGKWWNHVFATKLLTVGMLGLVLWAFLGARCPRERCFWKKIGISESLAINNTEIDKRKENRRKTWSRLVNEVECAFKQVMHMLWRAYSRIGHFKKKLSLRIANLFLALSQKLRMSLDGVVYTVGNRSRMTVWGGSDLIVWI